MAAHTMGPGTVLGGRYRLDDLLTDHDGARFWRATDTVLARSVAVHALASDDHRAEGVLAAARESVRVTDPHFLRVLDCDDDGRLTWVINEWGSGISLDLLLHRGTLPPSRAAWLAREVAEAIAAAHAQEVYHGRLNPESVLVTDSGAVKVIGFVTMRAFEGPAGDGSGYGGLDPREADVIDLAGILYAALTGKWPGVSASAVPPAPREGGRPLRPRQVRAGIPRTLDTICDRVLNREASQHSMPIETAQEIAAALSDHVGDPGAVAPLDVPSMYAEPTIAIRPGGSGAAPDPDNPGRSSTAPDPDNPGRSSRVETPGGSSTAPGRSSTVETDPDATVAAPMPGLAPTEGTEPTRTVPPLEPFEEPVERPLFADHERRVPKGAPVLPPYPPPGRANSGTDTGTSTGSPTGSTGSSVGMTGTGSGYWPFEDDEDTGSFTGKEGRGWLKLAAVIALIIALVVAMFLAFNYGRGQKEQPGPAEKSPSPTKAGPPLKIAQASDFDPEGNPSTENPDEVPLALDGKPSTGWRTMTYRGNPELGGLKSGVGLLLDLGTDRKVSSVQVRFAGSPTSVELYAAPAGVSNPPTEIGDVDQVTNSTRAGEQVTLRPSKQVRTRYLVVWLTSLPQVSGGYRGEITEVSVYP